MLVASSGEAVRVLLHLMHILGSIGVFLHIGKHLGTAHGLVLDLVYNWT